MLPLEHRAGFRLVGELDISTVPEFLRRLDGLPEAAEVIDLADLSFMDASGLHALELYAQSLDGGRPLVLENVPARILRLFALTGAGDNPDIELHEA
jgi:anti-anti-sigma factor